jgi:hypothetical protein
MYAAQSPAFLNSVKKPQAATTEFLSASLPLGISINNGNGRPWLANAPNGASGMGTISVLDPQGYPLAGAPSQSAGGIFAGYLTNRNLKTTQGINSAALGTTILTKSPDLTGRAVFAAVQADGSVAQFNVLKGVDSTASRYRDSAEQSGSLNRQVNGCESHFAHGYGFRLGSQPKPVHCRSAGQQAGRARPDRRRNHVHRVATGARQAVTLYSDLLLHNMGPAFDDMMKQGSALGSEWRTPPLWKVSERNRFLHDGRALSLTDAITAHGGLAQQSKNTFMSIDAASRQAILSFLGCL